MLRLALSLLLAIAPMSARAEPAAAAAPAQDAGSAVPVGRGRVEVFPGPRVELSIVDAQGRTVATVVPSPDTRLQLDLPAGTYRATTADGSVAVTLEVASGGVVELVPPGGSTMVTPPPVVPPPAPPPPVLLQDSSRGRGPVGPPPAKSWKRWASPMFSAMIPGVGQMVNREAGKGVAILLATGALAFGTMALGQVRDPAAGADGLSSGGPAETARLLGRAAFGGALMMLYPAQIMQAHRVGAGKGRTVLPRLQHKLHLEFARYATVAHTPDGAGMGLFRDFNLSLMGQVARRFSLGLSDLGLRTGSVRGRTTFQAGIRAGYRFLDRRRTWLGVAVGALMQGTLAAGRPAPLASGDPPPADESMFGGVLYAQLDARFFILDRWAILLAPRLSVPLSTRFYGRDLSLPRYAPTLELGTGVGVYF